jgi:hypothetical protein
MNKGQALNVLVQLARGADGAWTYWEIDGGQRVEKFTGVIDADDPMSLLWAYRAASARLKPQTSAADRKQWLRLIEAYETLVTP